VTHWVSNNELGSRSEQGDNPLELNLSTFINQIKELASKYRKWIEPVPELTKSYMREHSIARQDFDKAREARKEVLAELRKEDDVPEQITSFLNDNYDVYYTATPEECQKIREAIGINREFEDFLLSYAQDTANSIHRADDVIMLKRGLVALSVENCGRDDRDTWTTLADLYVSAESAGIDPKPLFLETARISSKERPRGGSTPLSEVMMNFDTYTVVRERRSSGKNFWRWKN
jgi:hypothetical protein